MRTIKKIIIHCSATPEGKNFTAADIDQWHRRRGFRKIGYHYVILLDGTIQSGRPLSEAGAHCLNHNKDSIGICYIGGLTADGKKPKDTRTIRQKEAMRTLIAGLRAKYPAATLHGHNEFAAKACPCFKVPDEI